MSKTFTVKGPFVIPVTQKTGGRIITTADAKKFCESHDFLDKEVGCYVFAFRAAKGLKPVYIGKATKSFEQEVFTEHKRNKYNEALVSRIKGTPVLFFVCLIKGKGPINKLAIDEVETFLIQAGLAANKDILNDRKTKTESWSIEGIIRGKRGPRKHAVKSLRRCLNFK